jgi:hypothetical protein
LGNAAQAFLFVGFFRMASESARIESQFPIIPMCMLLLGPVIQAYIIFWFVANGEIFD